MQGVNTSSISGIPHEHVQRHELVKNLRDQNQMREKSQSLPPLQETSEAIARKLNMDLLERLSKVFKPPLQNLSVK